MDAWMGGWMNKWLNFKSPDQSCFDGINVNKLISAKERMHIQLNTIKYN